MINEQDDTWVPPGAEPEWVRWFDELADVPVEERAARLAVLAGDRPELAARLEHLFAAEEGSARLLSRPVLERAPELVAAALAGETGEAGPATHARIGPYRLLDLLGRGGMGEVYRAERADGVFEQRVALKLVKRGMDTEEILRRFHRERQILARLEACSTTVARTTPLPSKPRPSSGRRGRIDRCFLLKPPSRSSL